MSAMGHILQEIAAANRAGEGVGIYSCCSANEYVLRAALKKAREHRTYVLIESTANQVDQFGGYIGMTPEQFYAYVLGLARELNVPSSQVILGGDHLGPLTFAEKPEAEAMALARELVRRYVLAGFTKIHIDTSMKVGDDDAHLRLPDEVIARRGAELCAVAEAAYTQRRAQDPDAIAPVYVVGSEVPIPGGAQEAEEGIAVTEPSDLDHTLHAFRDAFLSRGLEAAWERVVAVVVQPGVEFGSDSVFDYSRSSAAKITGALHRYDRLVLEGHSTDYQTRYALREMVEDGVAILKVGPALTFAVREGLFALECIERELFSDTEAPLSGFRAVLEAAMLRDDKYWRKHYHGTESQQKYDRAFSLSDRARYYLTDGEVRSSIRRLMDRLGSRPIPYSLLSQYLPRQAERVRTTALENEPNALLEDHVGDVIEDYLYATLRH